MRLLAPDGQASRSRANRSDGGGARGRENCIRTYSIREVPALRLALVPLVLSLFSTLVASASAAPTPLAPRVLVVVAFADDGVSAPTEEAAPWVEREGLDVRIRTAAAVSLRCFAARTVCLLISGEGKVNAVASLLSLGLDPGVDLRRTYVIVSGIGGVSPETGTIGTAAWATWIVDYDIAHEMDARELPASFPDARFQQGCFTGTWCGKDGWRTGTEVFELDPRATRFAYGLTKSVALDDPPFLAKIRAPYPEAIARAKPHVERCDILGGDTYWVGTRIGNFSRAWMKHWTNGAGTYCMTAMEDTGYAGTMKKLAAVGRVDYHRFFELRAGSDFDRPHAGQTAIEVLRAGITAGTFPIAVNNAYLTSRVVERYVAAHWATLQNGLP
jgi:purine nucleoside permease